ncbi:MAG TPA: hypothetical protein VMM78_08560, partial [Thermomicrobiales bacterium]|nr:hypothetical protein [Thermomicrobiales bacterium]
PMGGYLVDIGSGDVLNFPDAITVDAAGNIYVADMSVFVFDATGAPIDTWESTDDWSASHGIAIGANGMFYALDRVNSTVNYFSGDGARLGSWGDYGAEPGEFDTAYSLTTATR